MNLTDLYLQHQKALTRVARRITKNTDDADDAVQEAFLTAMRSDFRGECAPFTWLYHIVRSRAIDRVRAKVPRQRVESVCYIERPLPAPPDPSRDCELAELQEALAGAIEQLPIKYRTPFRLHMLCEWPCAEVAKVLNLPRGTVLQQLSRARKMLQVLLAKWDPRPGAS